MGVELWGWVERKSLVFVYLLLIINPPLKYYLIYCSFSLMFAVAQHQQKNRNMTTAAAEKAMLWYDFSDLPSPLFDQQFPAFWSTLCSSHYLTSCPFSLSLSLIAALQGAISNGKAKTWGTASVTSWKHAEIVWEVSFSQCAIIFCIIFLFAI